MVAVDNYPTSMSLLRDMCAGSDRAWARFMDQYRPLIGGWCRRRGLKGSYVEDVTEAIWSKLYGAAHHIKDVRRGMFRRWLKTVVANAVADHFRGMARVPGGYATGRPEDQVRLEELAAADDLATELDEAISRAARQAQEVAALVQARVRPHNWQAFALVVLEGLPASEAAERLEMSFGAVHQATYSIKAKLREEWARLEDERSGRGET